MHLSRPALLVAAVAGAVALLPSSASAATTTFDGRCSVRGNVTFDHGVKVAAEPNVAHFRLPTGCTGTLSGDSVSGRGGELDMDLAGKIGCFGGTVSGPGTLRIGGDQIPVTATFKLDTPEGSFTMKGADGGSADGSVDFLMDTPPGQMARCPFSGLQRAALRGSFTVGAPLRSVTPDAPAATTRKRHRKHSRRRHGGTHRPGRR